MVAFKKMWDDVSDILVNEQIEGVDIIENFHGGIIVKGDKESTFVTKDDFVDFWCKMNFYNKVEKREIYDQKLLYIYNIVKKLPYISENSEVLQLNA